MDSAEKAQFATQIRACAQKLACEGVGALGPLYDLAASRMLNYAKTLTRHYADAEDSVQAALVRIAMKPHALASARFPWAYLLAIVRNEALTIARRRRSAEPLSVPIGWDLAHTPSEELDIQELIREAIKNLPSSQAEVILLKIWEGLTFLEIGEILGEPSNTAASRYRYAIGKLSRSLCQLSRDVLYEK